MSLRVAGIVLILIGLVLLGVGFTSTDSFADQVSDTFTGRYTQQTMGYLIGGGVTTALGALLMFMPGKAAA